MKEQETGWSLVLHDFLEHLHQPFLWTSCYMRKIKLHWVKPQLLGFCYMEPNTVLLINSPFFLITSHIVLFVVASCLSLLLDNKAHECMGLRLLLCLISHLLGPLFSPALGTATSRWKLTAHSLSCTSISCFLSGFSASARGHQESLSHSDSYTKMKVEGVNKPKDTLYSNDWVLPTFISQVGNSKGHTTQLLRGSRVGLNPSFHSGKPAQ